MKVHFHSLLVTLLCCSIFMLTALGDETDFIEETGKALKNIKVMPGSKRTNIDYHNVEQEAGRAVLKLLDAKIGKKVTDAAKEVTDFLNDAVGHHAQQRAQKLKSDKQKELSLLHLGTKNILTSHVDKDKPEKNKDGSFLVHFKIPYLVTPVDKKKEQAKKKFHKHHKHGKKVHLKKYHHHILHHHRHHHKYHHPHALDAAKHPAPAPPSTYAPQAQVTAATQPLATQAQQPPNYNAIDLNYNGYNWTYSLNNDTNADMVPCQGSCMEPCTDSCNLNTDCCCCPDQGMMMPQPQPQMVEAPAAYPQMAQPVYQQPQPVAPPPICPGGCKRNCFTYCPRECCGVAGKRDEVARSMGSGNEETVQEEGSGGENDVTEEPANGQTESSETTKAVEDKEKEDQQTTNSAEDEGSTNEVEEMD